MRKLSIKNAFLFIGAMIGAGFATGAELMVYFKNSDIVTIIFSALLIGSLSIVFVYFGKIMYNYPKLNRLIDMIMLFNSLITFIAMQAGIEELFKENYCILGIGLITAIIISILSAFSLDFTKKLNVLVIPIVLVMAIWIFVATKPPIFTGNFTPMRAMSYASMNLMLGGYLIAKDSQDMNIKSCLGMASIISLVIGAMMVILLAVAKLYPNYSMPIYSASITAKLGGMACAIIYLAILTTIIGAGKVIAMNINNFFNKNWYGSAFLILLSIATHGASFKFMVDTFYPITGYVGVIVCGTICILVFGVWLKLLLKKGLNKQLSPCR